MNFIYVAPFIRRSQIKVLMKTNEEKEQGNYFKKRIDQLVG